MYKRYANILEKIFTENECYIEGEWMSPTYLMVHSTGAPNPTLRRYVGPADELIGKNLYNNHWNTYQPEGGRQVCCHGFIGLLADDETVATVQTLPWTMVGWHCGGEANLFSIGIELCEPEDLDDKEYFKTIYAEAVQRYAELARKFNISTDRIISHAEGYDLGWASNHGDPHHWWNRHDTTMDDFRRDVEEYLKRGGFKQRSTPKVRKNSEGSKTKPKKEIVKETDFNKVVQNTLNGRYGNGEERKRRLAVETIFSWDKVMEAVDHILYGDDKIVEEPKLSLDAVVIKVINGDFGNGDERVKRINEETPYDYDTVQDAVNKYLENNTRHVENENISFMDVVNDVILGEYGNGEERYDRIHKETPYDYWEVMHEVNRILYGEE